jgi:hypothetical protein
LIAERVLGQEPGSAHEIGDGVLLGRGKSATIRLTDRLASGSHARIAPTGERMMIEDLGSTNGTFVNGVQLSAPAALNHGDRIRLGESEFLFEQAPPMPPPPPPVVGNMPPPGANPPPPIPPDGETVAHDGLPAAGEPAAAAAQENTGSEGKTGAEPSFPAIPLLAAPVPERTLELADEAFGLDSPVPRPSPLRASPPPHPDSPLVGPQATERPAAPIRRRPRTTPAGYETPIAPPRGARRLRGFGGRSAGPPARGRLLLAGGVLAIAAIAVVVVLLHGGGGGGGGTPGSHRTPPAKQVSSTTPSPTAPARSAVTVTVLNGTAHAGLASQLSAKLVDDGFAKGAVGDTTSPTVTATTVGYTTGNRAAAEEVAGVLHLGRTSVVSLGSSAAASAGTRPAKVVVTIGANYPH